VGGRRWRPGKWPFSSAFTYSTELTGKFSQRHKQKERIREGMRSSSACCVWSDLTIPVEIFLEIQGYLNSREYFAFTGTARELFRSIKVQTQKLLLEYYESQRYLQNPEYQLFINSKIQNPYHQVTLCLDMRQVSPTKKYGWILDSCDVDWYDNKPKDWIERINHRKFVRLSYGREITSALYNEQMTILSMPGLTDVTNLQFVNDFPGILQQYLRFISIAQCAFSFCGLLFCRVQCK
jgi:hypothetical protein